MNGEQLATFNGNEVGYLFSPNGGLIASLTTSLQGMQVFIRHAATGILIRSFDLVDPSSYLFFSPDSRFLVVRSRPVRILDVETGETRQLINGHDDAWFQAFSPQGERFVTAHSDQSVRVWETASGKELLKIVDVPHYRAAWFSPDGSMIRTMEVLEPHRSPFSFLDSIPSRVLVYDAASGRKIGTYGDASTSGRSAEFSPDGRRILSKDVQECELYDLESGKLLFSFPSRAAFSPDGENVLTQSSEDVRIWQRRRPEWWWGVFWMPQFWAATLLTVAFAWSLRRDYKRLMWVQPS